MSQTLTRTGSPRRFSAHRLRENRQTSGLSRDDVAQAIGKTVGTVRNYEQGRIVPPPHVLVQLADLYGVAVDELFHPEDPDDEVARYAAEIRRVLQDAPPLTSEQRAELRALLRGVA
jgi:transcriptional regulator with XRE-family HTH domain